MSTEYHRFDPARPVAQYRGQAGPHNGQALDANAYAAIAEAKVSGGPVGLVVQGEWVRDDGVRYLDFAVPRDWIEAHSNYRGQQDGSIRWVCPECGFLSGAHSRGCKSKP